MKYPVLTIRFHNLVILLACVSIGLLAIGISSASGSGFSQQRDLRGRTPDGKLQPLPSTTLDGVMDTLDGMNEWLGPAYSAGDAIKDAAGRYQSRETVKNLIKETHPENVHKIYRQLPGNIHEYAKTLETAGKYLDYGDSALAYEEAGVSLIYGDGTGATQALANDSLSGVAATAGAWAGAKGGAVVGGALGGPPGAVVGGGVGAVAGAVGGAYGYDKYGKPIVDKTADAASQKITDYLEKTENDCRRLRTDLMLLRNTPYAKGIDVDRILYLDKERRDYGWRLESLPISRQLSEKDKQEIHRRAEEIRLRQTEERARNLQPDKINKRITELDRLRKTTTDSDTRKRIEYEIELLSKKQSDLQKAEQKGAEERVLNLPSEKIGDRITDLDRQWKATTDPEARKRIEYELSLLNKRLEKIKKSVDKKPGETAKEEKEKPELDSDGDGVVDRLDNCPGTKAEDRKFVDASGCAPRQLDLDGDGVKDEADDCPGTKAEERASVNDRGCAPSQLDSDHDGVKDNADICPGTDAKELFVDASGCAPSQLDSDGDGVTDDKDRCAYTLLLASEQVDASGCSKSQLARLAAEEKEPKGKEKSEKDKQYYETGRRIGEALGQAVLGAAAAAAGASQPTQPTQPTKPTGKKPTASSKPPSTTKPGGTTPKYPVGTFSGGWSELKGTIKDPTGTKSVACNTVATGGHIQMNIHGDGTVDGEFYNYLQSSIYSIRGQVDESGQLNAKAECYIYRDSVCWAEMKSCTLKGTLKSTGSRPTGGGTISCGPSTRTSYCTGRWGY